MDYQKILRKVRSLLEDGSAEKENLSFVLGYLLGCLDCGVINADEYQDLRSSILIEAIVKSS